MIHFSQFFRDTRLCVKRGNPLLSDILIAVADFLWGTPMTVVLVGTGLYLSIRFRFYYNFRKIGFNWKNTYGRMFQKSEGAGTISGFAAACTAMANTIGVGNIGGVATAVVSGGPGALFWMWVSSLLGMSTKACEIILGQRYRVKYSESMDEYMCDRSFVMKNALGWKKGAVVLSVACFVLGPWTCCVQTESVTGALEQSFGIDPMVSAIVLGVTCFVTIAGGLKRISAIMERVVPIMAVCYILGGIGILILNWSIVPEAVALIFKSAFTPMAGVGGFAGATARDAIRYGIARGLYSNDAGTGYGIIAHASAKTDHPVRQSFWGWGEVFTTLIVCTVTGLSIIMTNVYIDFPEVDSAALTTVAFEVAYGPVGGFFLAAAITIFAWTTIIGMYYSCAKSVNYAFGDTLANRRATPIYMVYYMIPCVFFYNIQADALWAMTDLLSAAYVAITLLFIFTQQKEIFRLFRDFWDRYIPARERGSEYLMLRMRTTRGIEEWEYRREFFAHDVAGDFGKDRHSGHRRLHVHSAGAAGLRPERQPLDRQGPGPAAGAGGAGPRELLHRRRRLRHHLQLPGHHPRPDGQGPHPGGGGVPHHPVRGAASGGPGAMVAAGGPGCRPGLAAVPGGRWALRGVSGGRFGIPGQLRGQR